MAPTTVGLQAEFAESTFCQISVDIQSELCSVRYFIIIMFTMFLIMFMAICKKKNVRTKK